MKNDLNMKTSSLLQSANNEKRAKDELKELKKQIDIKETLTKTQLEKMKNELEEKDNKLKKKESKISKFHNDIKSCQFGVSLIKYFDNKDYSNNYANKLYQKCKVQKKKINDLEKHLTNDEIE